MAAPRSVEKSKNHIRGIWWRIWRKGLLCLFLRFLIFGFYGWLNLFLWEKAITGKETSLDVWFSCCVLNVNGLFVFPFFFFAYLNVNNVSLDFSEHKWSINWYQYWSWSYSWVSFATNTDQSPHNISWQTCLLSSQPIVFAMWHC